MSRIGDRPQTLVAKAPPDRLPPAADGEARHPATGVPSLQAHVPLIATFVLETRPPHAGWTCCSPSLSIPHSSTKSNDINIPFLSLHRFSLAARIRRPSHLHLHARPPRQLTRQPATTSVQHVRPNRLPIGASRRCPHPDVQSPASTPGTRRVRACSRRRLDSTAHHRLRGLQMASQHAAVYRGGETPGEDTVCARTLMAWTQRSDDYCAAGRQTAWRGSDATRRPCHQGRPVWWMCMQCLAAMRYVHARDTHDDLPNRRPKID